MNPIVGDYRGVRSYRLEALEADNFGTDSLV
jgi:hypothetical protein